MSVCVVGCGRSGTNMLLEMLRGSVNLKATEKEEDKKFFTRDNRKYPKDYLTKCDTVYIDYPVLIRDILEENPELKIVWTVRDPRDMVLSKLYRGRPIKNGGDCKGFADDATPNGCIKDIEHMYNLYRSVTPHLKIKMVKMESIIDTPGHIAWCMCDYLKLDFDSMPDMIDFPQRMRNKFKKQRYGNKIDKSQVGLWKHVDEVYDGYFKDKKQTLDWMYDRLAPVIEHFNYEA